MDIVPTVFFPQADWTSWKLNKLGAENSLQLRMTITHVSASADVKGKWTAMSTFGPLLYLLWINLQMIARLHDKKNHNYHTWYDTTAHTFQQTFTFLVLVMLFFAFWASWDFHDCGGIARRLFFADGLLMGEAKKRLALTTFWNGQPPTTFLATLFRLKPSWRNHWSLLWHFLGVVTLWRPRCGPRNH